MPTKTRKKPTTPDREADRTPVRKPAQRKPRQPDHTPERTPDDTKQLAGGRLSVAARVNAQAKADAENKATIERQPAQPHEPMPLGPLGSGVISIAKIKQEIKAAAERGEQTPLVGLGGGSVEKIILVGVDPAANTGDVPSIDSGGNIAWGPGGGSGGLAKPTGMAANDIIVAANGTTLGRIPIGTAGQMMVVRSDGTIGYVDQKISVAAWGAVGDNTADDTTPLQNAINAGAALAGGATVELQHNKTYKVTTALTPANNVSVKGAGPSSVIAPAGPVSAFLWPGTSTNYLTDVTFRDFKVDGAGQTGGFNVATKGIQCPWSRRVTCDNVQVWNTIATGIAFDFPDDVKVTNCTTMNTGRLWTAGAAGGAGIGIGVSDENTIDQTMVVANCHCNASGSYGIFFEAQDTFASNLTPGIRIIGNYCTGAKKAGIGVSGSIGVIVQGNVCSNNGTAGTGTNTANIAIDGGTLSRDGGANTLVNGNVCVNGKAHGILVIGLAAVNNPRWLKISNNVVYNNGGTAAQDGHGIFLNGSQHALVGITVNDNQVTQNKQGGIVLASGTGHSDITIRDNDVFSNGQTSGTTTDGIRIDLVTGTNTITGLTIRGNRCYKQGAIGNQVTGINIVNATVTNSAIKGNDVRLNGTNGMLVTATIDSTVRFRDNEGFESGTLTVAVPATTVATAAQSHDSTFYITTGAGTTTVAISNGPTVTLPASGFASVRVRAGETLTPTYTNAPTWLVAGE